MGTDENAGDKRPQVRLQADKGKACCAHDQGTKKTAERQKLTVADMVESGADIVDLDWMVDMAAAAAAHGHQVSFCGNFDPVAVMLQGTPQEVYEATQRCMGDGGPRSISAAGCEIPDGTPAENLQAQAQALKEMAPRG